MSSDGNFDVVIVGAGAAGCALAYRLTADTDLQVLLLEGGNDERPDTVAVPARWPETLSGPLDYGYMIVPQQSAGARVFPAWRARVLGGTTTINAMIYSLPGPDDLASWGPGWSYEDCAPALRAMESHRGGGPTRGSGGPAVNGPASHPNQLNLDFLRASIEAGFPAVDDLNGPDVQGAGYFDLSIGEDGMRADAAQSYLRSTPDRPNLQVWTGVAVQRLNITDGVVASLSVVRDGVDETLPVIGQVVLSAGAIDTPALLLRSGVGPADELRRIGIAPVVDLPGVGRNLHDHPSIPVMWSTEEEIAPPQHQFAETALLLRHAEETHGQTVSVAFHHIALLPPEAGPPANAATALVGLYEPRSRGSLTLDPADPDKQPLIDLGLFTDNRDVVALAAGIELVRRIGEQPSLERYGLTEFLPGPDVDDRDSLEEFVRATAGTYQHLVGTCAIGSGELSVVDFKLCVRSIDNLRIADASVIPTIPGAAPSATIQMIGWRAAELILADLAGQAVGQDGRRIVVG